MKVTRHVRDVALMRVLRRHQITRARDRLLFREMEAAWTREIGLRSDDLLETVNRLALGGVFVRHETLNGPELELTETGAREIRRPASDEPRRPTCLGTLLSRVQGEWNTFVVLHRARRRTLSRLNASLPSSGANSPAIVPVIGMELSSGTPSLH